MFSAELAAEPRAEPSCPGSVIPFVCTAADRAACSDAGGIRYDSLFEADLWNVPSIAGEDQVLSIVLRCDGSSAGGELDRARVAPGTSFAMPAIPYACPNSGASPVVSFCRLSDVDRPAVSTRSGKQQLAFLLDWRNLDGLRRTREVEHLQPYSNREVFRLEVVCDAGGDAAESDKTGELTVFDGDLMVACYVHAVVASGPLAREGYLFSYSTARQFLAFLGLNGVIKLVQRYRDRIQWRQPTPSSPMWCAGLSAILAEHLHQAYADPMNRSKRWRHFFDLDDFTVRKSWLLNNVYSWNRFRKLGSRCAEAHTRDGVAFALQNLPASSCVESDLVFVSEALVEAQATLLQRLRRDLRIELGKLLPLDLVEIFRRYVQNSVVNGCLDAGRQDLANALRARFEAA